MAETLYELFEALDPERMDSLGPPEERRAGHRLYEAEKHGGLTWVVPERHLKATCEKRQVEFGAKEGALIGACACGATLAGGACRHLYALLFAICNLLDDERYRVFFRNNKFREHLKQVYWSAQGETRNPQPRGTHPELRLYVDENGYFSLRVSSAWHKKARERGLDDKDPLYRLVHLTNRGADAQLALVRYLNTTSRKVPLTVHLPERAYPKLRWQPSEPVRVVNALSVTPDGQVAACHEIADRPPPPDGGGSVIPLPPFLALDPNGWTLNRMDGFVDLDQVLHTATSLTAPGTAKRLWLEVFHHRPALVHGEDREQALRGLTLRGADGAVGSEPAPPRVVVTLTDAADDDTMLVRPQVFLAGDDAPLPAGFLLRNALRPFLYPVPSLRSADCRRALWRMVDALFVEDDTDTARATREAILNGGGVPPEHHEKARELLDDFEREVLGTRRFLLRVRDGRWVDVEVPHRALGFGLAAARRILHAVPAEYDGDAALCAPAGLVRDRLGVLLEALAERGIDLRLDGQPVHRARLAFRLTQKPTDSIDWFELHPAVQLDGFRVDPDDWARILRGGAMETADGLAVLTTRDHNVLARLQALVRGGSRDAGDRDSGRIRRLAILEWLELEAQGVRVDVDPALREVLDRLRAFQRMDDAPVPGRLQATLRDYQLAGYRWLAFLYHHRFGACLADDMGLGKTIQTIALLAALRGGDVALQSEALVRLPHLVVVPASLVFNWDEEIARFCPDLRVAVYTGPDRAVEFDAVDVVITTYGILTRDLDRLRNQRFHVVVFDEAQALKNLRAARTEAARALEAAFVICLTGTPLENHVGEFYSILDLALPGLLGPYPVFMQGDAEAEREAALLRARPFVLRRTKEAILAELPPKVEQTIRLDLSERQREAYVLTVDEVRNTVRDAYAAYTGNQAGVIALSALMRLRQICIAPALVGLADHGDSPKIEFLLEQLAALREEGHAALVFSQFTRCLDLVEQALDRVGINRLRLDGSTSVPQRKLLVKQFQSGDGPSVFLLSLKSGGAGLNLTRASYVFHLDPWWNPAVERQASDRAHRIGQIRTVFNTRLIMRHTVEEKMELLKQRKEAVFQAVVAGSEGRSAKTPITREDLDFLLG